MSVLPALLALPILMAGLHPTLAGEGLTLSFGAYESSPVVLTHFAIEEPLAETQTVIVSGKADRAMPRTSGSNALSLPEDAGRDGKWRISAQWVELMTDRAWRGEISVPVSQLTRAYDAYELNVIFGPNGLLLIGSDRIGNQPGDRIDVAMDCAERIRAADHAWRRETGIFPELPALLDQLRPTPVGTDCADPGH
ncbi:MAG: hypothetical protein ACK5LJ_06045 [Paracoccus sp. (in: a-proteobacteria)]